ncbi:hypothetical protein HPP92_027292 [Vanilla planifolia]|uniref:Uncharacterized protein n=1 Tax=Vanilla planifolia TaxID=51239 RepID=A0A835U6A4_VANPL|nr:hypothetical protein HPP92_027292 [Vanilla planifolia]
MLQNCYGTPLKYVFLHLHENSLDNIETIFGAVMICKTFVLVCFISNTSLTYKYVISFIVAFGHVFFGFILPYLSNSTNFLSLLVQLLQYFLCFNQLNVPFSASIQLGYYSIFKEVLFNFILSYIFYHSC